MSAFSGTQSKPSSLKRTPFNQTSARFVSVDYKARSAPGPGQYRIPGFADENLRKAVVEGGKKPPFNIASIRRLNMAKKDEFNMPGPSSYDVKTKPFQSKVEHPSANFVSSTAREIVVEVKLNLFFCFLKFLFVSFQGYSRSDSVRCHTCLSSTCFSTSTAATIETCAQTTRTISQCCQTNVRRRCSTRHTGSWRLRWICSRTNTRRCAIA